jgi:fructuronate reductase
VELVARPRYDRGQLRRGIVHLGIGAFARAHLAVATEAAIHASGDLRWGITGVSLRHADTRDALAPQQGRYTVAVRDGEGTRLQVVGCLRELLVAPEDPGAVLERIAAEDTRIVSLTITEKGYLDAGPGSAVDFIVQGLARRRAAGRGPLTLLSLDNLAGNGDALRERVLGHAGRDDTALAAWIENGCTFPNSMVDRIVPRTTDEDREGVAKLLGERDAWPVVAEPFFDWVVEDRFAAGRPEWDAGGARFVAEARPWEVLKLRMVNGAHSQIAYLGVMAGWRTVDSAIAHDALARHVQAFWRDEVEPTLAPLPGLERAGYRARLLERFRNPALGHRTLQIAMDGSQKLPPRWMLPLAERIVQGKAIDRFALGVAAWLHFLRGRDERGDPYPIDDPLADALVQRQQEAEAMADDRAQLRHLTGFAPVFGALAGHPVLIDAVLPHWRALRTRGVAATLAELP